MNPRVPLSTLLSHALVAFTIEFDNEAEQRMSHQTTRHGGSHQGPWLASLVMWSNCMRFVGDTGVSLRCLKVLARTETNLHGMQRWGYITVESGIVHATPAGRVARGIWASLFIEIEQRWVQRFGKEQIDELREALFGLVSQLDPNLPDCLPIVGYGQYSQLPALKKKPSDADCGTADPQSTLLALLSKVLLAFALDFEKESKVSLAICANVLRLTGEDNVRIRELPGLSGVSKEAIAVATGYLARHGYASIRTESRTKVLSLTLKGEIARQVYRRLIGELEERWRATFGEQAVTRVRDSLQRLEDESLFRGLTPHPSNWRASAPAPEVLPDFPIVSHRGGYPDGS